MAGAWDQFVGPGATRAEVVLQLVGSLVGGILCLAAYLVAAKRPEENQPKEEDGSLEWPQPQNRSWYTGQSALVLLLAMDMMGGVITNATSAAKRWYHRRGQTAWHHLGFVSVHAFQISLVAQMSPIPLLFFATVYAFILTASAVTIFATPLYLQRAVAMMFGASAAPLTLIFNPIVPTGLEWFIPILSIKLLVCHLVQEAPFRPVQKEVAALTSAKKK